MTCEDCGARVSATGFLGGMILCPDCARDRREEADR